MLASVIQRQLPIGSRVSFLRKDGRTINGILSEIGRDHITIEDDQRYVTVLLGEITGWEIAADNDDSKASSSHITPSTSDSFPAVSRNVDDQDVAKIMIEVEARFRAQLDTATIQLSHSGFSEELPVKDDADAAAIWDRIRNRFQYASRINELSGKFGRIQPIIHDLETISERYQDSPEVHSNLAYLYTLAGDERACAHYRTAAIISNDGDTWLNLAASSLSDEGELACYGLRRYFLLVKATENLPAWYVYVRLILRFSAYVNLTGYLQTPRRSISADEARLLVETGIFILKTTVDEQAAAQLTHRWLSGGPSIDIALQTFKRIERNPSGEYQRAASAIDACIAAQVTSANSKKGLSRMSVEPRTRPESGFAMQRTRQRGMSLVSSPSHLSSGGWEQIYRDAALAHTEGRVRDARELFKQAIDAGGGPQVYEAFFKMEVSTGARSEARSVIREAIRRFPDTVSLFVLYGHRERSMQQYETAAEVFRQGIEHHPENAQLRMGLAQCLVQIGTEASLREAGQMFGSLEKEGKLHTRDGMYQRFRMLQRSPRVAGAFDFFRAAETKTGIARYNPADFTDIVVDVEHVELSDQFGLSGSFLVRCFHSSPRPVDLRKLTDYLSKQGPQDELVLQTGRRVVLNPALAFISVPSIKTVHDQVMRILGDNQAAVIPLDDSFLQHRDAPVQDLQETLARYLGRRDLYDSTLPVSGRRFFGRERLLVQLGDALHRGQFLGIYGLRKIGKTSLVYQLRNEHLRHDAVAYVDLQASLALNTGTCDALYWEVERALHARLSANGGHLADLLRLGKENSYSSLPDLRSQIGVIFKEDLRMLLDAIVEGQADGVRRVVILLDELERILPVAGQHGVAGYLEFFGLLRGLAQTERYRGTLSCVVVAANAAISERGYWEGRENPVFAFYKAFFVPPLPEDECDMMIRNLGKGMSVYWEREATSAVYSETCGHPFLTRTLCSYIARQQDRRPLQVTRRMVDEHIHPFLRDQGNMMEQITELLTTHFPDEARVLQQIALGETPDDVTDETIRHLLNYYLVITEHGNYRVTLNLLHRWLRRRAGLRAHE